MDNTVERWVWTELIGFDNTQPDFGVQEYVDAAGFAPFGVCLLVSSPDFALQHPGMDREVALPADICSRGGHEHNQTRKRQVWTNWQVKGLLDSLRRHGVRSYASFFAGCRDDKFHHEWATDHPETRTPHQRVRRLGGINPLSRLKDGRLFEDILAGQVAAILTDYGFDGWHGPDGYGPLSGPLHAVDYGDGMTAQFVATRDVGLPPDLRKDAGLDWDRIERRAQWIWRNARQEWIAFWTDRWAAFWKKMAAAVHAIGKKAIINSSWGRGPFESLYRYGVDYRKIAASGVDAMLIETAAAGLCMDPRPNCTAPQRHYDFLSTVPMIRAAMPGTRLIFLHNVHDVCEQWDTLRHAPTVLERDIFSLGNVYSAGPQGRPERCVNGFLACLADAISPDEWKWLRERWEVSFDAPPTRVLGATLVWSDAAMDAQVADFATTRRAFDHRILFELMTCGAPVHIAVRADRLRNATGPLLVLNPHLFPAPELEQILTYRNGPVIMIGAKPPSAPAPDAEMLDAGSPAPMWFGVFNCEKRLDTRVEPPQPPPPGEPLGAPDPAGYWDHFACQPVSDAFWKACARLIVEIADAGAPLSHVDSVTLMVMEQTPGVWRVAVKNKEPFYLSPRIDLRRPLLQLRLRTGFPQTEIEPEGSTFSVRVPPKGIVVIDAILDTAKKGDRA